MTYQPILAGILSLSAIATSAVAEPYCAQMLDADALERRYQRLAPIYNSTETGWIFASDQLEYRYVLSNTEQFLFAELVSELAARGTDLAIMVAPPRPVVAGQQALDDTTGQPGAYDLAAQAAAFHEMMVQISEAGAIAPDLLSLTQSQPELSDAFYFQRDTHWTNIGAAFSALALGAEITGVPAAFDPSSLATVEMAEEPGSLSRIVEATCDTRPDAELSALFDYTPHLPSSGGLLSDASTDGADVVLLGTSFSDRYGRDQYQTADALSAALQRPVANHSVSGGGMVGPFETYLQTGAFADDQPDLSVWEFPYTYQLTEANLRRLLGALRADENAVVAQTVAVNGDTTDFDLAAEWTAASVLGLRMTEGATRDMVVRLHFADGDNVRLRLRRKSRMEEVAVLDTWWLDLRGFESDVTSISIEPRGDSDLTTLEVMVPGVGG